MRELMERVPYDTLFDERRAGSLRSPGLREPTEGLPYTSHIIFRV
jgi:hypothetical protein